MLNQIQTAKMKMARQRGFTFIELMAVLALISLIVFGVLRTVNSANSDAKQSETERDINALYAAALKKKGFSPTFSGITCDNLVSDKWIDVGWSNCTAVNPYNGNYTVAPNTDPTGLNITAVISDTAACRRLASTYNKIYTAACAGTTLTITFTIS